MANAAISDQTLSFTIGTLVLFVALVGTALAPQLAVGAERGSGASAGCDAGTMRGVYAVHLTGTTHGLPLALVGHVAFKGERSTSGILTEVWNGQSSRYTFDGTYTLDADCNGELSFRAEHPLLPDYRTFAFQPSAGGSRASFILTGAKGVPASGDEGFLRNGTMLLSGAGERLSRAPMTCDRESARGTYAFHAAGTTAASGLLRFTFAGRIDIDGEGGISIHSVGTAPHTVDPNVHYDGTYSLDPGCRGTIRLSGEHFGVRDHHTADFYAAARGNRIFTIFTRSWVEEFLGIGVDPMGINDELAHGNEQEFSYTLSGLAERRVKPAASRSCNGRQATIVGSRRIRGTTGADVIVGGAGRDSIDGRGGNDRICAGRGRDRLRGGPGHDRLFGGAGGDRLYGGGGRDRLSGGSGKDRIATAGGGRDRVNCGPGSDRVSADDRDRLSRCERVRRRR